jgi:hypothetical protein
MPDPANSRDCLHYLFRLVVEIGNQDGKASPVPPGRLLQKDLTYARLSTRFKFFEGEKDRL